MKNTHNLMKHFASVLRKKALGTETTIGVDPNLLKYLTRKELVEILLNKHNGSIPKELNLVEMENQQLLELIGDELFILAHLSQGWCKEAMPPKPEVIKEPVAPKKKGANNAG